MTQNSLYQKDQNGHQGYDRCFVTKLLRNYRCPFHVLFGFVRWLFQLVLKLMNVQIFNLIFCRSHPAILKIPNELFYENELQVFANQMEREAFCQWEHLPKKVRQSNVS